jgi:flagellar protein FlaG
MLPIGNVAAPDWPRPQEAPQAPAADAPPAAAQSPEVKAAVKPAKADPQDIAREAERVEEAVDKAQEAVDEAGVALEFSVDEDVGRTIVKVVDKITSEIIRQIPSEEMLALARSTGKLKGVLVNDKV